MPVAPGPGEPAQPRHAHRRATLWAPSAFERRTLEGFPPKPLGLDPAVARLACSSRRGPLDKALLGMITDNSAPRAMYALGPTIMTTTLSLTAYLHATVEEIAEVGDDFILVECEGRVGGGGASDERSSYWRRDGKLLATSEQLASYRELRRNAPEQHRRHVRYAAPRLGAIMERVSVRERSAADADDQARTHRGGGQRRRARLRQVGEPFSAWPEARTTSSAAGYRAPGARTQASP